MTRPARFTQSDVARAFKGAVAAGVPVRRVVISRTGDIVIEPGEPVDSVDKPEPTADSRYEDVVL